MNLPDTEREALKAVINQAESDLNSVHAEIVKLQGFDPDGFEWPEWSPQANSKRWHQAIREKFNL